MSRILVVDDDAVQLDLRKQLLEIAGYQVEIALTAHADRAPPREALRRPGDPGSALSQRAWRAGRPGGPGAHPPHPRLGCRVPVIVLSGWPEDLYGEPEEQLVSRILLKPVKTREFLDAIRGLLDLTPTSAR